MAERSAAPSNNNKKINLTGQEKTGFEKFSIEIKESVFQVLYLILKDEDSSLFSFFFSVVADYLQNLAFSFHSKINSVWKAESLLTIVFNFFNFFQLQTYFGEAFTFESYLVTFYLVIAVIILMIINIIYVSYAFSKKRVSAIWPVVILRSVTSAVCTLFFLPVTELLISMLQCQYADDGVYRHSNYPEIECFVGAHIIHATVAIIVNVIFMVIGFIVALAYFEVRMLTEDPTARQHSRGDVFFILNKISLQLSFTFFPATAQWGLILVLVLGAIVLWLVYNVGEPYYRKECSIFFKIITTYYLWTVSLVLVSKCLEETSFTGGLVAWIIGLPFIGVIMLTSNKSRASSLVQTTSRFRTSEQLLDHLRFVLQLMDTHKTDHNASILLTGYIEKHRDTCEEDDCPLKIKIRRKAGSNKVNEQEEILLGLTLVVDRMYQTGIKKFKNSIKLRIAYSVFLIERVRNMKKAEQELAKANELNPGFEDQFIIYRLTRLISDGLEGVDVVGLIAWESYKNLYHDYVKESANLHKEFWLELKEDKPDLQKLNFLGSKVNNAMNYAKDYWARIQKIRPDDPTILRTYGRFLIDIQNDIVEGYELIQRAKKMLTKKMYHHQITRKSSFDVGTDRYPYVEVISNGNDLGKIRHVNLLFTILVGVNKDEIQDKKINNYMPDLYALYHDSFLQGYNMRDEDIDIDYLDKDNELFVKSRSGYIIPVTIRVSRIRTEEASNQVAFGAWFKSENNKKNYVYFICQHDGLITDMTATAITMLNLSVSNVKKNRMNIEKIVPGVVTGQGFVDGYKEVLYKTESNGGIYLLAKVQPMKLKDEKNKDFLDQYQFINKSPLVDGIYGFIVRLEKAEKTVDYGLGAPDLSRFISTDGGPKGRRGSNLLELEQSLSQHRFSKVEQTEKQNSINDGQLIYGFNTEHAELEITELFQNDGVKLDFENLMKGSMEIERKQIDYGQGISHKKYIRGKLIDITEDYEEKEAIRMKEWEDDELEEGSLFLRKEDNLNSLDVKKRKDRLSALKRLVKDALETNTGNTAVLRLKALTGFWVLSIFVIVIVQFILLSNLFTEYRNKLHIMERHAERIIEICKINSYLIDFLTLNNNPTRINLYPKANVEQRRDYLKNSVSKIVSLARELEDDDLIPFMTSFEESLMSLTVFSPSGSQELVLAQTEAIFLVISRAYVLHLRPIEDFNLDNPELLTVLLNVLYEVLPVMRRTSLTFRDELVSSLESYEYKLIILYSLNLLVAVLSSLWGMRLLILIEQQKENVLFLFLEIPPRNIEGISRKRDKFIEFFEAVAKQEQNNQVDDNSSDSEVEFENMRTNGKENIFDSSLNTGALSTSDPNSQEDEEDAMKKRKKLINKYKSTNFKRTANNLKVLLLVILGILNSVANHLGITLTKAEVLHFTKQFYTDNSLADTILTTINKNRLMLISPNLTIQGQNISSIAFQALQGLNDMGNDLTDFFLYVIDTGDEFEDKVKALFFGNACSFLVGNDITSCENSPMQPLKLGFFNLKEQMFKKLVQTYDNFQQTSTLTEADVIEQFTISDDFKLWGSNILENFNMYEKDFLQTILKDSTNLLEIILIIYLIAMLILVLIFWLPFIMKLNSEVWRTTRMITMIPLDVVNNIPSIKRYLKNLTRKSSS